MSAADASQTQLAYVAETTLGTTPATPVFKVLRYTGESLEHQKDTTTSNEIRADRNVTDVITTGLMASGGVDFELSYGTLDDFLEAALFGTWTTNVLKNGIARKSFTLEKMFELGSPDSYFRYPGCMVSQLSLNVQSGAIVTGSLAFMGFGGTIDTAIITGATYTAANTNPVLNAASDFASLTLGGVTTQPCVQQVTLQVDNTLRAQRCVGNLGLHGIGAGRFAVTGTIRAFFESNEQYAQFLASTASSLTFTVGRVSGSKYTFLLPNLKYTKGTVVASGNDQDVIVDLNFQGIYDSTTGATMQITRAV